MAFGHEKPIDVEPAMPKIEEEDDVSVMIVAAVDDGASSVSGGM